MKRRLMTLAAACFLAVATASVSPALAAPYPDKPIRLIVPTTAGSVPDQLARWLGEHLAGALGQPVVIDNRPGAGGTIGLLAVARAAPDGYTLGIQTLPYVVTPSLIGKMPYDTERDLAPVTLVNWSYNLLVVPAASPARSVADLVALAKAQPGGLKYSSPGNGTPAHLALALFERQSGIKLTHIPYKGGPASMTAVLAGDVDMTTGGAQGVLPHLTAGKLRALATTAPRRMLAYPELPTLGESGHAGVELADWQGVVAPAATPRAVIDRLHSEIKKILGLPASRQHLESLGMEPAGMGPDEFAVYQHAEIQRWSKLVREAGITAE